MKESVKRNLNMVWKGVLTFLAIVVVCFGFLFLCACIPQSALRQNVIKSAEYFNEVPLFENTVGTFQNFKKDNYADCISINIAWNFGDGAPFYAVITSDYAYEADKNVNQTFYKSLMEESIGRQSYSRYWHGSAGVLRILLCFMNIESIRYMFMVMGILLHIAVAICLYRKGHGALAAIYVIGFISVNGVFALGCLEYGFVFILMLVMILCLLLLKGKKSNEKAALFFLISGMLTAFFDFLTAETLTFTVPFVIYYIVLYGENGKKKSGWLFLLQSGICWGLGYAGMFLTKWGMAVAVLGMDAFSEATGMAAERISGAVSLSADMSGEKASFMERLQGIFARNAGCLYWGTDSMSLQNVLLITIVLFLVLGVFWYMGRQEKCRYEKAGILILLAFIPYLRFLVLSNHSFIHYFFTYRAQMITVMVVLFLIYETTFLSIKKQRK